MKLALRSGRAPEISQQPMEDRLVKRLVIALLLVLSIPLAVLTASRSVGSVLLRIGLGRQPEETTTPPSLAEILAPTDATAFSRAPA